MLPCHRGKLCMAGAAVSMVVRVAHRLLDHADNSDDTLLAAAAAAAVVVVSVAGDMIRTDASFHCCNLFKPP